MRDYKLSYVLLLGVTIVIAYPNLASSQEHWVDAIQHKWPLVKQIQEERPHAAIFIAARGECEASDPELIKLRNLALQPFRPQEDWIQNLMRSVSKDQPAPNMHVDGKVISIRWPTVSNDILGTQINDLNLRASANYDPERTKSDVLTSKEVLSRAKATNTKYVLQIGGLIQPPTSRGPHLPDELHGVTVEAALIATVQKFGGVMTYMECRLPNGQGRYFVQYDYPR